VIDTTLERCVAKTLAVGGNHGAGRIAAWAALLGLAAALLVAAISGRLALGEHTDGATIIGNVGSIVNFVAPFVAVLAAFLSDSSAFRRSVWLASGLLALALAVLTVFSGVWLLFAPAGIGLLVAWWQSKEHSGVLGPLNGLALTAWLLIWLGGALAVLHVRETPGCWSAIDSNAGL
jgi:hypothetical protein